MKKQCTLRLFALVLTFIMVLSMIPARSTAAQHMIDMDLSVGSLLIHLLHCIDKTQNSQGAVRSWAYEIRLFPF